MCGHPVPTTDAQIDKKEVLDQTRRNWNSRLLLLFSKIAPSREFLGLQCLGLGAFTAEGLGSIPDRGTKIPHKSHSAAKKQNKQKTPQRKQTNKINYKSTI